MGRARAAAGQKHLADGRAAVGQRLDVAAVLERHAFKKRPKEMAFVMPSRQAIKPAALVRAMPAAVEKRVEHRVIGGHRGTADQIVDHGEGVAVVPTAFHKRLDVPFQIGR